MKKEIMTNEPKGYGIKAQMKGNAASSDSSGEKREKMIGGMVADAKMNKPMPSELSGGRSEGNCYVHGRMSHQ
jgi:hypothetical protein